MALKIDLHVHTCYSHDSLITPRELVKYACKAGLNAVAITDHDRIDSALMLAKTLDILIIPGMEISSLSGHIIGLNLHQPVPKRLSVEETVKRIHENGGVAVACHPYTLLKAGLKISANQNFDAVEVINASAIPFTHSQKYARAIAKHLELPQVAGSDAHYAPEIGTAYTLVNAEPNVEAILKAIRQGKCTPIGNAIPIKTRIQRLIKKLKTRKI